MLATKQLLDVMNVNRSVPFTGTIYIIEYDQWHEFWQWCDNRGIETQLLGRLYDRHVFQIVQDPSPEFTLLRWAS